MTEYLPVRVSHYALDDLIRAMPQAANWVDDPVAKVPWRNQFIFNLALARGRMGVELDSRFNIQLNSEAVE